MASRRTRRNSQSRRAARPRNTRSSGRRERRLKRLALVNILLVAGAIAGGFFLMAILSPKPFDQDSLCEISDELPAHTAVIIDKTDAYTEQQADLIAIAIRRAQGGLAIGERFTLFELDADGRFDPRGAFSLCNPGRGNQVNPLFRNPERIEARYTRMFETPFEAVLADLVVPKEAPSSPILEAIARLAQTEFFSPDAPDRELILVSDMLQNSALFSAYGGGGTAMPAGTRPAGDVAEDVAARFGDNLRGTRLVIRLIARDSHVDLQRGELRAYWDAIFRDLGIEADWRDL